MVEIILVIGIVWWAQSLGKRGLLKRVVFGLSGLVGYITIKFLLTFGLMFAGVQMGYADQIFVPGTRDFSEKFKAISHFFSFFLIGIVFIVYKVSQDGKLAREAEKKVTMNHK